MFTTTAEIVELVQAFEERRLERDRWTHAAFLTIGLYYCVRFSYGLAVNCMRDGVRRLNDEHGVPNSIGSGYHETMTVFWMILINQFVETTREFRLPDMAKQLVAIYHDPRLPLRYYSRELLTSPEAREQHVHPDIERLYLLINSAKLTAQTGGSFRVQAA